VQILDHDGVEANLPPCGWSAAVIGREFSPHVPDAVPAVDDAFVESRSLVVPLRRLSVTIGRPAASARLASVTVERRSIAPSGDVNLAAAAACWTSQ
jgi:hypothetical protein